MGCLGVRMAGQPVRMAGFPRPNGRYTASEWAVLRDGRLHRTTECRSLPATAAFRAGTAARSLAQLRAQLRERLRVIAANSDGAHAQGARDRRERRLVVRGCVPKLQHLLLACGKTT